MLKQMLTKVLSLLLVMTMFLGLAPMYAWAETETGTDTGVNTGAEIVTDGEDSTVTEEPEINEDSYGFVTSYSQFMELFVQLEVYAQEYADLYNKDPGMLVLNFVRCGVERYLDSNWRTLAGEHEEGFTNFVIAKDADEANTIKVMPLRNLQNFTIPNGQVNGKGKDDSVDFGHMFGCMNISYVNKGGADISGWAGDLCDLLKYSVEFGNVPDGTIDEMAAYIKDFCFGVDASKAYGWNDFYGDMDGYYFVNEYKKYQGGVLFSDLMKAYYENGVLFEKEEIQSKNPNGLSDFDRTVYFINNRFGVADDNAAVRKAVYDAYSNNASIALLENSYGVITYNKLREACCYAFADYIYSWAKGCLIEGSGGDATAENGYYTVFSEEHSILAPGIEQDIKLAQTVDGKQIAYYIATVDVTRGDVDLMVNYHNNEPPVPGVNIGLQRVEDQAAALVHNYRNKKDADGKPLYENFNAIVATNGAGYNITTGTPSGLVVMEGVEYYPVTAPGFFGILKDGTAVIGTREDYVNNVNDIQNTIREGIAAFGTVLVKDGKVAVTKSDNYTSNRASRTAIGIDEDGKVIMMVLDGRQLPWSAGGSPEEIAQIMLEAGCVQAVNLDGGGSTTYLSKPAGSDNLQLVNRPSDGKARSVATSLVAVSTAKPSTEFHEAIITSDYEYITAGTTMQFSVTGVSNTGNSAPIPAGAYWQVSDTAIASIDATTGLFTAQDYGTVTVQYVVNGEVKGEKKINVVVPDDLSFAEESMTAIFDQPKEILLKLWYNNKPVAFTPLVDAGVLFMDTEDLVSTAGVIDGMAIIGDGTAGIRSVTLIGAMPTAEDIIMKFATVNFYYEDEATFDFDNADMGNRSLAWNRTMDNARTLDNQVYYVTDRKQPVVIDYTFALDMSSIDIPPRFEDLKGALPGGDDPNATAWTFLLYLAERVCIQTYVKITAEFSQDVNVDITDLKVVTEYFTLSEATVDENNVLTVVCNWVNQTQPIDASTANPLCILDGIRLTVKDTAGYYNNRLVITNNGTVSYDIYLAATTLYTFPNQPGNEKYGLIPYMHEPPCRDAVDANGNKVNKDLGAHFASQYLDFAETYIINTETREGWIEQLGKYYYYVNNIPVTGMQLLTDRTDSTQKRFYEFDAMGALMNEQPINGLQYYNGNLYYAINGVVQTGWREVNGQYYYFDLDNGSAFDGVCVINEKLLPNKDTDIRRENYTYTFVDHVLTKGCWTEYSGGKHYRWAGDWKYYWFDVDGKSYFAPHSFPHLVATGYTSVPIKGDSNNTYAYHWFNADGELQAEYSGPYNDGTKTVFLKNGVYQNMRSVFRGSDGYYYATDGGSQIIAGTVAFIQEAYCGGLIPGGKSYTFDETGRLISSLLPENAVTTPPTSAEAPTTVEAEVYGHVVSVKATTTNAPAAACKVGYWDETTQKYIAVEAAVSTKTAGGYDFAMPETVTNIAIVIAGDVNGNGVVDTTDYVAMAQMILMPEISIVSAEEAMEQAKAELASDLNGNGKVNAADLIRLARSLRNDTSLDW